MYPFDSFPENVMNLRFFSGHWKGTLTLSMDWFLFDNGPRHERLKIINSKETKTIDDFWPI